MDIKLAILAVYILILHIILSTKLYLLSDQMWKVQQNLSNQMVCMEQEECHLLEELENGNE